MLLKKPLKIETYVEGISNPLEGKPGGLQNLVESYYIFFEITGVLFDPIDKNISYILANGKSYAVISTMEDLMLKINECRKK
mgnify:FL=1